MLIGSTTERLALREEIDRAYEESAKIDQIKDANKQQEEIARIDIVNRRKKLREERAARVLPVPSIILHPTTVVQVRHISLGLINRIFKDDSIMQNCYDWIGSLQEEPEVFSLHEYGGDELLATHKVRDIKIVLYMGVKVSSDEAINSAIYSSNSAVFNRSLSARPVRATVKSVRYRHLIGSPTLLPQRLSPESIVDKTSESYFGSEEVERFFGSDKNSANVKDTTLCMTKVTDLLEQAVLENGLTNKSSKHLIVQRDNEKLWPVIFRQTFDLSKEELNVRFAEEAGSDNGGPFREFLCQAVNILPEISCMFFGEKKSICFTNDPSSVIDNHYFVVGQLVGLSY